jgi:hypothetical protein
MGYFRFVPASASWNEDQRSTTVVARRSFSELSIRCFSAPDDLAVSSTWLAASYTQYHRLPGTRRCLSVSTQMHGTIRVEGKTGVGPRPPGERPRFQLQGTDHSSSATLSADSLTTCQPTFSVMPSPQTVSDQQTFVWSCSRMGDLPSHFPIILFIRKWLPAIGLDC